MHRYENVVVLTRGGLLGAVLQAFGRPLPEEGGLRPELRAAPCCALMWPSSSNKLRHTLLSLVSALAACHISIAELRLWARLVRPVATSFGGTPSLAAAERSESPLPRAGMSSASSVSTDTSTRLGGGSAPPALLTALADACGGGAFARVPYLRFDLSELGYAGVVIPAFAGQIESSRRPFPPPNGYSLAAWVFIEKFAAAAGPGSAVPLLRVTADAGTRLLVEIAIESGRITVSSGGKKTDLSPQIVESGRWYHIVVTHSKPRIAVREHCLVEMGKLKWGNDALRRRAC